MARNGWVWRDSHSMKDVLCPLTVTWWASIGCACKFRGPIPCFWLLNCPPKQSRPSYALSQSLASNKNLLPVSLKKKYCLGLERYIPCLLCSDEKNGAGNEAQGFFFWFTCFEYRIVCGYQILLGFLNLFLCVERFSRTFVCVPHVFLLSSEGRREHWMPWNWSYRWLWTAIYFWESNLGPLEEQPVLFTTETSL